MTLAIVGAGIAGLACAARLAEAGHAVRLFEQEPRPGGRMATDLGAQYFTVRDPAFAEQVRRWEDAGLAAAWPEGPAGAMVGVPEMTSLTQAMAAGHDLRCGFMVKRLVRGPGGGWWLEAEREREGPFDAVILAVPAANAATLLALHDLDLARVAATVRSLPCWSAELCFTLPLEGLPPVLRDRGAIAWAARNASKPGRPRSECWTIHADPEWSRLNLEADPEAAGAEMAALFAEAIGRPLPPLQVLKAHRWRFARPVGHPGRPLWNGALRLGACGDWCIGARIEDAWRAGRALASEVSLALISASAK